MLLKDILEAKGKRVWSVRIDETLQDAVNVLVANKVGALLVFDSNDRIVGVISERDIMRECHANPREWFSSQVGGTMTRRVIVCEPEDGLEQAMQVMTRNRIRHLPVVEDGRLCGVVSIGDVVKTLLRDKQFENENLKEYIQGS